VQQEAAGVGSSVDHKGSDAGDDDQSPEALQAHIAALESENQQLRIRQQQDVAPMAAGEAGQADHALSKRQQHKLEMKRQRQAKKEVKKQAKARLREAAEVTRAGKKRGLEEVAGELAHAHEDLLVDVSAWRRFALHPTLEQALRVLVRKEGNFFIDLLVCTDAFRQSIYKTQPACSAISQGRDAVCTSILSQTYRMGVRCVCGTQGCGDVVVLAMLFQ
jgi:hypothetical protein